MTRSVIDLRLLRAEEQSSDPFVIPPCLCPMARLPANSPASPESDNSPWARVLSAVLAGVFR